MADKEEEPNVVRQTIVETIAAPRLTGITTRDFVVFKEAREIYERRVKEKNLDQNVQVQLTTYRDSIPKSILQIFVIVDWVPVDNIENITEKHLEDCISTYSAVSPEKYDLALIEEKISNVKLERADKEYTLQQQVWRLIHSYLSTLENCGYCDFSKNHPKLAVEHIMRKVTHPFLRNRMLIIARLKTEQEFKKDFNLFVRTLANEATHIDRMNAARRYKPTQADIAAGLAKKQTELTNNTNTAFQVPKKKDSRDIEGNNSEERTSLGQETKKRARDLPKCLNTECKKRHFIRDCDMTSKEKSKLLIQEYKARRDAKRSRKEKDGAIGAVRAHNLKENSSLFSASFCSDAVNVHVLTDSGSDANLISNLVLEKMLQADPSITVTELAKPMKFSNAGTEAGLIHCDRQITADVMIRVRHGSRLLLRNLKWLVCKEKVSCAYIARHVLSAIGLNNRVLLAAALDKYNGVVDVPEVLAKDGHSDTAFAMDEKNAAINSILRDTSFDYGCTFHSTGDEEMFEENDLYIDIGSDSREELENEVQKMIATAVKNGLSSSGASRLEKMIEIHPVFRIRLGNCPAAKVKPMEIRLSKEAKPVKVKCRRYSPDQRMFLSRYINQLERMGFVEKMPDAAWQAAPLLVPKSGSAKYRMTVDLRPINSVTIKEPWPMPNIDAEVSDFAGCQCFAQLDFVSGYWQLPLHPKSMPLCCVVTPDGIFSSRRVLQGLTNAVSYFQRTVEPLFSELRDSMKAWLDDFSLYAKTEKDLLDSLEIFLKICHEKGLYLSAKKCNLYTKELKWCGRIFSENGYRMDPSRISGLKDMEVPQNAGELCEFVHCCRWMYMALPLFSQRVSLLNNVLEEAYTKSGRRTKRSIRSIPLKNLSWGPTHVKAFEEIQEDLRRSVTLSYPDISKTICVFTDASSRFWSGIVTQCDKNSLKLQLEDQKHEPLAFLGSEFKKSQLNWSTFEKEGFSIYQTFKKTDYMLYGHPEIHIFTDHRNLLFVFAPNAVCPALGHHIISKVQRWALFLSTFNYTIEHIRGSDNVFPDILTRWARGYRQSSKLMISSILVAKSEQLIPAADSFQWPSLDFIRNTQATKNRPNGLIWDISDRFWKKAGRIWIPDDCHELQLKLLVTAHCGEVGHRGIDATLSIVLESFYWSTLKEDTKKLVETCYHCLLTRSGSVMPRPLGRALHGKKPNEVIHIDYLYMGSGIESKKYILIIRDDLSSYTWLWSADSPTAANAAEALCVWIGAFGSFTWLVSDQGAHFKNTLMNELTSELRINHHFTTAYCPWANGSVERICREVKRACRALTSEWKLSTKDWPAITETMQCVLNQAPLKRLGLRDKKEKSVYRCPLEVFTGIIPIRPLLRALPIPKYDTAVSEDDARIKQIIQIDNLQCALLGMHRDVREKIDAARQRRIDWHNTKTNVAKMTFMKGDFVLVRRSKPNKLKLGFQWKGPKRIVAVKSEWVYEVEDLLTYNKEVVHARRLLLYRPDMDGVEASNELLAAAVHTEASYQSVESIKDIRCQNNTIQVQIIWEGLPDEPDWTWEPLDKVVEDIPEILRDYLQTDQKRELKQRALAKYFNS